MDAAARFAATAANRFLGARLCSATRERAELELQPRAEFVQEEGIVHGGILAMLADTTAVYLLFAQLAPEQAPTSIEFKLNFLAAAKADGHALAAAAVPVRIGRTIAVCDCEVRQGGTLIAKGTFTYLIRQRR